MCTVSWIRTVEGYDLLCNRDERLTRPRARMPRVAAMNGVRYIAPVDPQGGGTWIGVNEYGVTVCLVNAYSAKQPSSAESRGLIVRGLLSSRSSLNAIAQARRSNLSNFPPFTLVALDRDNAARAAAWDGRYVLAFPDADGLCPLTSSSLDHSYANKVRRHEWSRCRPINLAMLQAFHRSHRVERGPWSVCMHRDDAETVSFTHVNVSARRVQMHYSPDAPCKADLIVTTTLERNDITTRTARPLDIAG